MVQGQKSSLNEMPMRINRICLLYEFFNCLRDVLLTEPFHTDLFFHAEVVPDCEQRDRVLALPNYEWETWVMLLDTRVVIRNKIPDSFAVCAYLAANQSYFSDLT